MQQQPLDEHSVAYNALLDKERDDGTHEVANDLAYKRLVMVNVVFYGLPNAGDRGWVLIDAGLAGTASLIATAAEERFGVGVRPAMILLTHGHFDHVGALETLAERWDAPIYAHTLETPYLDGTTAYPPPDPLAGGGIMPLLSPLFPRGPINVSRWLRTLPEDGSVPFMPGWRWLHTPGHTEGHISLWREQDRTVIAGDAFITTQQESVYAVAVQTPVVHGPPRYFTSDWEEAHASVRRLAALEPERAVTGHGQALHGDAMRVELHNLADRFMEIAVPPHVQQGE